jgi:rhodanese-related sulfurtransferase
MPLDDEIIVYPAHGAGSSCGKNLSKETFSTLGIQKKTNYALREDMTKKEFVKELLDGMPLPPKYFKDNAMMNKLGYNSFEDVIKQGNKSLDIEEFKNFLLNPEIILLDVRHQKDFMNKHIPNSIFIGLNGSFAPWVGSIIEDTNKKILLITPEGKEVETLTRLSRVGFDNCLGFLNGGINEWENQGNPIASIETIKSKDFVDILKLNKINILDVRSKSEFDNKHIEGAINFPLNSLQEMYNEIKYEDKLYVHCAGGYRSVIAISILMKLGFKAMTNITEGFNEILKCNLNENCYNSINSLNCNNT